jgi:glutamyl-tRNA synthetase
LDANNAATTRFAPSPTGALHIGGARTALFNFLWARRTGGKFLLRFEDTDAARSESRYEESILADLEWLGLVPDEICDRQSARLERHAEVTRELARTGAAYACFCDDTEAFAGELSAHKCRDLPDDERNRLAESGISHCWRFKTRPAAGYSFRDELRGTIAIPADSAGDFVLTRRDGTATYLLAAAVDDHDSGVTCVIRGEEHIPNTPKQEMIFTALGWKAPVWVHIPMILDRERHKLSKRRGAVSVADYRAAGWNPPAVTAYLATLSWSGAPADRIAPLGELAEIFDIDSIALASPVHDEERMERFGKMSVSSVPREDLLAACGGAWGAAGFVPPDDEKILLIGEMKPECATLRQLAARVARELSPPDARPRAGSSGTPPEWFADLAARLIAIPDGEWAAEKIKQTMKIFQTERGLKGREFFHPVRIFLTGSEQGAPIGIILSCIGREETLRRFAPRV